MWLDLKAVCRWCYIPVFVCKAQSVLCVWTFFLCVIRAKGCQVPSRGPDSLLRHPFVARPTRRKWRLLKDAKDRLPTDTQAGVVYAVGCKDCPKVYIGETGRTVKQRLKEHQDHTKKGNVDKSAIANHIITTGHEIHWQARVIKREEHMLRRKVHQAVAIHKLAQKDDATMNLDRGMELSNLWLE